MLGAKYYRDYGHNYMILQCSQQETTRSYQYKILTSGKIGEILKCSVRYINGSTYYYYDISSRTTLDSLYRDKKMSFTQVKDVLCQIHGIYERLSGYFMDEAGLVLLPEHIYYDLTNKKYIGLYYPDYQTTEPSTYMPLMNFLLEHIDTEDRDLAEKMYLICEMAEENRFFIEDALEILENDAEPVREMAQESLRETLQEPIRKDDWGNSADRMETFNVANVFSEPEEHEKVSPKRNLFYPVFAVLSILGIAGAIAVCNIYELAQREEIVLYGVMAAMGVCLLLCLVGFFSGGKRNVSSERNFDRQAGEEHSSADIDAPALDHVINREMNLEMAGYMPVPDKSEDNIGKSFRTAESNPALGNDDYGNTVFFDGNAVKEYKLYAMDKKNKNHIELRQFPFTIGKMAGCVDYVLSDDSISRIHARFDKQGEKIILTDMNSTNGTYKNGLRMQPQETVEIEPGDEVRFGNLNYCYR